MSKKNIVLVGMMGSGKTTIAKALKNKMDDFSIVDIDSVITELEGRSINQIFETNGEEYFRQIEKLIIKSYEDFSEKIISTGGGTFNSVENIDSLKKNGMVFYLSADEDTLYERIKKEKNRPLLKVDNPKQKIKELLNEREDNYKLAHFEISTLNKSAEQIAEEIISLFEQNNLNFLTVKTPEKPENSYPIVIEENILANSELIIKKYCDSDKYLIVTNSKVNRIHGYNLNITNSEKVILKDGEIYKNFESYQQILDKAIEMKLGRQDAIIAFGGGVIGDMAGFAAATYQRGINFIQIPTTLLSQVDSSVGGKVAINHPEGKNMIGCFYQPKLVLSDTSTLKTLDKRQLKTGLSEVIKYAFIEKTCNAKRYYNFFNYLKVNKEMILSLDPIIIAEMIEICCKLKSAVIYQDERESGLRAILNFGHTFGHAIEKVTNYETYTHGEAIAIGMKMAINLSYKLNLIDTEYYNDSMDLINSYNLIYKIDKKVSAEAILDAMSLDKKIRANKIRLVLPIGQGKVDIMENIDLNHIKEVVQQEL